MFSLLVLILCLHTCSDIYLTKYASPIVLNEINFEIAANRRQFIELKFDRKNTTNYSLFGYHLLLINTFNCSNTPICLSYGNLSDFSFSFVIGSVNVQPIVEFKSIFIGDLNLTNLLEITDQIPIALLLIKSVRFWLH